MRLTGFHLTGIALCACALASQAFGAPSPKNGYSPAMQAKINAMQARLTQYEQRDAATKKMLQTFDTLDFVVFSNQQWVRLHESHAKDIIVDWPDGHHTNGIQRHIADLKAMFVYAPDTRIKIHPVRFGVTGGATGSSMGPGGKVKVSPQSGGNGFTCVTGIMEGTFTKPMPLGNGKFVQPTGKKFTLPMCTVGHWKNGVMIEEWLYWDNATYMKQLGIGK
ncbi:MAG TPA: ester cyclase [Armatimonadota bacterium]|jgi:hypothetical protein